MKAINLLLFKWPNLGGPFSPSKIVNFPPAPVTYTLQLRAFVNRILLSFKKHTLQFSVVHLLFAIHHDAFLIESRAAGMRDSIISEERKEINLFSSCL